MNGGEGKGIKRERQAQSKEEERREDEENRTPGRDSNMGAYLC